MNEKEFINIIYKHLTLYKNYYGFINKTIIKIK